MATSNSHFLFFTFFNFNKHTYTRDEERREGLEARESFQMTLKNNEVNELSQTLFVFLLYPFERVSTLKTLLPFLPSCVSVYMKNEKIKK
jgi:hypothetical protein